MSAALPLVRRTAPYAAAGTVGTLLIGYGVREFLRATGGGYYCCNHAQYQGIGIFLTFLGWVVIGAAVVRFTDRFSVR